MDELAQLPSKCDLIHMAIKKGQFQFVNVLLEQVIKRHGEV